VQNPPDEDAVAAVDVKHEIRKSFQGPRPDRWKTYFLTHPRRSGHRDFGDVPERGIDRVDESPGDRLPGFDEIVVEGGSDIRLSQIVTLDPAKLQRA
jgi:hypothetical protein